jgi:hypothetical protein
LKTRTLFTPESHLIRPSDTFSPSDAEKGNPMGEAWGEGKMAIFGKKGVNEG